MNYNQIPDWYLNFRRSLDRFTRMATVVALVISGVWGAMACAIGAPDPMFRVLSVRTAPVHAALVSFGESHCLPSGAPFFRRLCGSWGGSKARTSHL